jgi:hypothetical protein
MQAVHETEEVLVDDGVCPDEVVEVLADLVVSKTRRNTLAGVINRSLTSTRVSCSSMQWATIFLRMARLTSVSIKATCCRKVNGPWFVWAPWAFPLDFTIARRALVWVRWWLQVLDGGRVRRDGAVVRLRKETGDRESE